MHRVSPLRTREPAAPPTCTSHLPPSMAVAPTSLVVDSAQLPGAARHRQFHLVGRFDALEPFFDLYAQRGAVTQTEAAEIGAHAGFAGAEGLGVGVARRHANLAPNVGQILLGNAQQVYALPAGNLDHLGLVFFGGVGDAAQFVRRPPPQ